MEEERERERDLSANDETKSSYEKYEYSVPRRNVLVPRNGYVKSKADDNAK